MKWLFALLLALAIFGGAAYFAYNVLFKQEIAVQKEQRGEIPATPMPDLSLPDHPEIAVIGDLAAALSHGKGEPKPVPGVSPAAKQMGRTAARNLLRRLRGEPTQAFRYIDYGNLATIGRKAAIVDLSVPVFGSIRFSGFLAWLFWLFAHIYFLIGFRNRLAVMLDWAWAYWAHQRQARIVNGADTDCHD